jgi:hypothetical protein
VADASSHEGRDNVKRLELAEVLRAFIADPPRVHRPGYRADYEDTNGLWWFDSSSPTHITDAECYEFVAKHVREGSVTMETGLGLSTICFALLGCEHTAMFLDPAEEAPLRAWADEHGIDMNGVRFVVGPSDESLRAMPDEAVDLFFIDGGHGYPTPQLDWFYGAARLRKNGVLVLDDVQLWGPHQLDQFLGLDPRWERLADGFKWSAFRRTIAGPVAEDFDAQGFLPVRSGPRPPRPSLRRRIHVGISRHLPEGVKAPMRRVLR